MTRLIAPKSTPLWRRWAAAMHGDVFRLKAPRDAVGHEQQGRRYAVVVQSDDAMLSTVLAAPTSTSARPSSLRSEIEFDGVPTLIMIDQVAAIGPELRLGEFAGRLSAQELLAVDQSLRLILGLD